MRAFAEVYLEDAMENLGEAVDYSVNRAGFPADEFNDAFLTSGLAAAWEAGSPKVICGMSGTELAETAFTRSGFVRDWPKALETPLSASPEYWAGWVLAYYQWHSSRPFSEIRAVLPLSDIVSMYSPLHEAPEDRFVDRAEAIFLAARPETRLRRRRRQLGMSQSELARASGVNLRNIQQYEQRAKDVNRAAGVTLMALGAVLGSRVEDLLETEE